ncbi:alpha/beta hydrolase [Aeromicrobium sp.]|uniref:alpha/beta hydrolase n=1 Tax=Aeromicrobium sp. TaxID=1871063 RepID=UPI003D6AF920
MGLFSDATALMVQAGAKRSARYGDALYFTGPEFDGREFDEPESWRIPTRHHAVRCDVYRPPGVARPPIYVHFHGGAFMMRFPRMDDFFARFMVEEAQVAVVNVDYDVAPQHRYPIAHHQAHDVVRWLTQHAGDGDLDGSRIAVGGFSAGGNLAASVCLQARDEATPMPKLQVLGVPSLDVSTFDKTSTVSDPMIGPAALRIARTTYFKDESRRAEPYASPGLSDDLHGLPPAVVLTAEWDLLRAEGDDYAERLTASGVDVLHRVVPGRDHYFLDGDRARARTLLDLIARETARRLA